MYSRELPGMVHTGYPRPLRGHSLDCSVILSPVAAGGKLYLRKTCGPAQIIRFNHIAKGNFGNRIENNRHTSIDCRRRRQSLFQHIPVRTGFPADCPSWPTIAPADGHDDRLKILLSRLNRCIARTSRNLDLYLTGKILLNNLKAGGTDEKISSRKTTSIIGVIVASRRPEDSK